MFDNFIDFLKKNQVWFTDLHYVVQSAILALLVTALGALIVTLFGGSTTSYYALGLGIKPPIEGIEAVQSAIFAWVLKPSLLIFLGLSVAFVILIGFAKTPIAKRIVFYVSLLALMACYAYILLLLFSPSQFEALLKRAKIGGFMPIVLYENKIDKTEHKHECQLVLHTGEAIICYFPEAKIYTEFPLIYIQRIDYGAK